MGSVRERRRTRIRKAKKKKTSIYDVYEPSELERGHFTEKDSEIRVTDMPERFQVGVCMYTLCLKSSRVVQHYFSLALMWFNECTLISEPIQLYRGC